MPADRRQRFDVAGIPHDVHQPDPAAILATVKELVLRRGQVGDLIIVHAPPGTSSEVVRKVATALEEAPPDGGSFVLPGLPGNPE